MSNRALLIGSVIGAALMYVLDPVSGKERRFRLIQASSSPDVRVLAMFTGWVMSWYGVRRRDLKGTLITIAGVAVTASSVCPKREAPTGTIILRKVS
jgi:hypothetical protein